MASPSSVSLIGLSWKYELHDKVNESLLSCSEF